jgi:hypothetical protein
MFFYYIYNKDKKPFSSFIFLFWAWIGMKYQRTVMQQEVRILFFNLIIVQNLPTLIALSCFIYISIKCANICGFVFAFKKFFSKLFKIIRTYLVGMGYSGKNMHISLNRVSICLG